MCVPECCVHHEIYEECECQLILCVYVFIYRRDEWLAEHDEAVSARIWWGDAQRKKMTPSANHPYINKHTITALTVMLFVFIVVFPHSFPFFLSHVIFLWSKDFTSHCYVTCFLLCIISLKNERFVVFSIVIAG